MLYSLRKYEHSNIAKQRIKIIKFYEEYGGKAAKQAFGADRRLISTWKKRLKRHGLIGLVPTSTRPHKLRQSDIPKEITSFIRSLREKYPRIGKEKIKPLLDKYCKKNKLKTISESSIGNTIKRHKFFFQRTGRIYHNPNSKWAQSRRKKTKRLRTKYSPKPKEFGYILSDTVERVTNGLKDYFYSAIDAKLKFAVTLHYKRLNSRNMKDFYNRFKIVYPYNINTWQSDNGSENLGEFEDMLKKDNIPHIFSYPNCPKINSYIERYNRTVQEEFIDNYLHIIDDAVLFNHKLAEYMIFYNTERPHKSLGLKSPMEYFVEDGGMSHKCVTYTLS